MMMLGKVGRRTLLLSLTRVGTSQKCNRVLGTRRFSTNNQEPNDNNNNKNGESAGGLTHHDSYRDLKNLDFMTAAKILFTTPPKEKKFGLDFHLVQLFFVCLPSLAVYLVALYARHEMKKMDALLEKKQIEEAKKKKATEDEVMKSNPQLLEVKERLESLEKTVKEIVVEAKNQRSSKVSEQYEDNNNTRQGSNPAVEDRPSKQASNKKEAHGEKTQPASKSAVGDLPSKQASNKQQTHDADNQRATQGGTSGDKK
uniref:uncharacterized protein LOC122589078 n=1 Tax=Erigeron canadensis TaxID=72917 RepID=UPI001CB9A1AF|nr:uncharacterized protein LOC122589078 [Erigeron canadensis]